jgi:hypothetical protein
MNVILFHGKHGGGYCVIKLLSYTQVHLLVFFKKNIVLIILIYVMISGLTAVQSNSRHATPCCINV